MKKQIAVIENYQLILSCDGDSLEVIGKSKIADDLRAIVADKNSMYNSMKDEAGEKFDPVQYLATSSMNFLADDYDYSEEKLTELKKSI